ncbi:MAG: type I DNA topoisomerase [Halieaceae bacterium]|nr:type I DNA topoisomerase [Halieaceae bacterium]
MGKSLVIVESPAKAKTINKYLGKEFIVKSSVGHIRDLPKAGSGKVDAKQRAAEAARTKKMTPEAKADYKRLRSKKQLIKRMGIDPGNKWQAEYHLLPKKEDVVKELRRLAEDSETIYLATDLDREGEAIAWHLKEAIGGNEAKYQRVVFNEITKKAITEAFKNTSKIDVDRVNAQQARRFLDRVVGYMLSPLLWSKIARGLSAGRVQSVAVRLIVEREREIRSFVPQEYWEIHANLGYSKEKATRFQVTRYNNERFRPSNEKDAKKAQSILEKSLFTIVDREDKLSRSKPPAPYITSTLQQSASTRLGFSVKKTMMLAQRLYEAGYITYMRTDSTNLSTESISECRGWIAANLPAKYLPENQISYAARDGAQEAHEAIRPSDVYLTQEKLQGMERDAERLYEMIWRQFVACQLPPAEYTLTTLTVSASDYLLASKGRIVRFDGFTRIQPITGKKAEDIVLPDLNKDDSLTLEDIESAQHFTKPTPRYGEASLVRELEKRGIGRPSTYAAIISTIQERGYVRLDSKRFYAEKMGDIVTERLCANFSDLLDYGFTAQMEESLDHVSSGQLDWTELLDRFYESFEKQLKQAEVDGAAGMQPNQPTSTDIPCPDEDCAGLMQIRTASTGVFLGCSGYSLPPKERCKKTLNLFSGEEVVQEAEDDAEILTLVSKKRCKICNCAMDSYLIDEFRQIHVCGNNPDCFGYELEKGKFRLKGYDGPIIECDKCGENMELKTGRFGKYFGCSADQCKNTRKLKRDGTVAKPKIDPIHMQEIVCEKCEDYYVLRDGEAGLFLAASGFPKHRETRAPFIDELIAYREEIPEKYQYILTAPLKDENENRVQLRWRRKTAEQYIMTEKNGKPTGWKEFYIAGKWQQQLGENK